MFSKENRFIFLIIIIFISACIETDIFLPALADMMVYFSISEDTIQSLLTWNFVGICISGPFYGPISDSFGRKKPLLFALGLFLLGSILTLIAQDFNLMLLGRVLQGLGSGGCFTLGTAIMFDVFNENEAIKALAKMNSIVPFIMAAAPMIGGYLNYAYGFRSNFSAITFCVAICFLVSLFFFGETLPKERRNTFSLKKVFGNFKQVSCSIPFWQTTLIVSLVFSAYLVFLAGISVLFVMELGVSKTTLPFFQAALLITWLAATLLCRSALEHWGIPKIKKIGSLMIAIGGIGLPIVALAAPQNPYLPTLAMMVFAFGANWVQGIYFPEGMALFPDMKGVTASILTSVRLLLTAMVVGLESYFYNGTIYPIVGVASVVILIVLATIFLYERKKPQLSWTT